MLPLAPVQFSTLRACKWNRLWIRDDAVPDFFDYLKTLFHAKGENFFNSNAHASFSVQMPYLGKLL